MYLLVNAYVSRNMTLLEYAWVVFESLIVEAVSK